MNMPRFEITQLWPTLGTCISGLDLRCELATAQAAMLRQLIRTSHLLVFPEQTLDPDDQVRVVSVFGPVVGPRSDGPLHSLVDVEAGDTVAFHSDYSFTRAPLPFISLYGIVVEGDVATTAFLNAVTACAELPAALREHLVGRDGTARLRCASGRTAVGRLAPRPDRATAYRRILRYPSSCHPASSGDRPGCAFHQRQPVRCSGWLA